MDGRYEFELDDPAKVSATFYKPDFVNFSMFESRGRYFLHGLRGVGKTSILRWLHAQAVEKACFSRFILFKSDLTENQRVELSKTAGFEVVETDKSKMEFSQDFKDAWRWFFFYQIGLIIRDDYSGLQGASSFLKLLGLTEDSSIDLVSGWMPKLKQSKLTIKGNFGLVAGEFEGELEHGADSIKISLPAVLSLLERKITEIAFPNTVYIFINELEVFKESQEQYDRDRRFVRDIIFAVSELNEFFRAQNVDVLLISAVRTEVLLAIGSMGQEIQRRVYDKGVLVHWDQFNCTLEHPILDMVRRKLSYSESTLDNSEKQLNLVGQDDVFLKYFPRTLGQTSIEDFLLNRSFYRPRDVVQRMKIAADSYPDEEFFSEQVLDSTEQTYSRRVWEEVMYGLSARYTDEEIRVIESLFAGTEAYFYLSDIERRLSNNASRSNFANEFSKKYRAADVLRDLFMFGAVGNSYFAGEGGAVRNRWIYRGDQDLFLNKRMVLQRALWRRFDAVDSGPPKRKSRPNQSRRRRGGNLNKRHAGPKKKH